MTAAEFEAFGQLSGATEAPSGASASESLGITPEDVQAETQKLCEGGAGAGLLFPPFDWPAMPGDVPAYEQFFDEFSQACLGTALVALPRVRAAAANRMARNQLSLANLADPPQESVGTFCGFLDRSKEITAPLLANGLEAAGIIPDGTSNVAEFGINLLIAECPELVEYLT